MRQPEGWLGNRLSGVAVTFTPAQLQQFAQILGVSIPQAVIDVSERLSAAGRPCPVREQGSRPSAIKHCAARVVRSERSTCSSTPPRMGGFSDYAI